MSAMIRQALLPFTGLPEAPPAPQLEASAELLVAIVELLLQVMVAEARKDERDG